MSLSSKLRAFTLLECLVALLVIAGSVQVYQGLTTVLVSNVKQVRQQENQDWLLFVQQIPLLLTRISKPLENKGIVTANSYSNFNLLTFLLTFR